MNTNRRDFIRGSALAGSAMALGLGGELRGLGAENPEALLDSRRHPTERPPHPLRILILGGTSFLGPHQIRYALDRGHSVSTFTRGQTEPTIYKRMYDDVEQLVGDRSGDHSALSGRSWDIVIDNSGRQVEWTRHAAELLRDTVDMYVYTSSTGVYLPYYGTDLKEDRDVLFEDPSEVPEDQRPTYGVMKALSERAAREVFGEDRTIVVRPTYIVGPADQQVTRFPYWPERLRRGGAVMIPGKADDRVQYIDVRDLTEWMIRLAETRTAGTFNVAGPGSSLGMHEFVHGMHAVTNSEVEWVTIDDYEFLEEHRVSSVLPWLMPVREYEGSARINIDRAKANGLTFRPLAESTQDVLEWWDSDAVTDEQRASVIDNPRSLMQREPEIVAAWKARGGR